MARTVGQGMVSRHSRQVPLRSSGVMSLPPFQTWYSSGHEERARRIRHMVTGMLDFYRALSNQSLYRRFHGIRRVGPELAEHFPLTWPTAD